MFVYYMFFWVLDSKEAPHRFLCLLSKYDHALQLHPLLRRAETFSVCFQRKGREGNSTGSKNARFLDISVSSARR